MTRITDLDEKTCLEAIDVLAQWFHDGHRTVVEALHLGMIGFGKTFLLLQEREIEKERKREKQSRSVVSLHYMREEREERENKENKENRQSPKNLPGLDHEESTTSWQQTGETPCRLLSDRHHIDQLRKWNERER